MLLYTIVQIPLEATPLLVLACNEPLPRLAQLIQALSELLLQAAVAQQSRTLPSDERQDLSAHAGLPIGAAPHGPPLPLPADLPGECDGSGVARERFPQTFPAILGRDLAGRVVALGPGVSAFALGDRVMARAAAPAICSPAGSA